MNFQFYVEEVKNSKEYKDFVEKNPKAYPCSGFFTIDKDGKDNQRHIDFYSPSEDKVFSFKLEDGKIEKVPMDTISDKAPEHMSLDVNFDFDEVEKLISDEMQKQKIKNKLQKIIISLQNFKGKEFLVCTIFVSMLGILKIHIDLKENKVSLFEKKSFFDIVRKV